MGVGFDNFGVDFCTFGLVWGLLVAKIGLRRVRPTYLEDSSAEIPHLDTHNDKNQHYDYYSQVLQPIYIYIYVG